MTAIVGTIQDSGGSGLTGKLRVTLDAPLVDISDTPDAVQVGVPVTYTLTNGVLSGVDLTESQNRAITYRFQFFTEAQSTLYYLSDGALYLGPRHQWTDTQWYTGPAHSGESKLLSPQVETKSEMRLDFHAIVPNLPSIEFASLIPTGITTDILDTAIRRLAELLTTNLDYIEILRGGPRWKGNYSPTTYYQRDDTVAYAGASWVYLGVDPAAGSTPSPSNPNWLLLADRGAPGGSDGNNTAYDSTGWNGALWAPSAHAVRDVIEQLARADNAALTGNPTAPTQPVGNATTRLATTQFVINEIVNQFSNAALTGNPTAPTAIATIATNQIATCNFVKSVYRYTNLEGVFATGVNGGSSVAAGLQTRVLNTIQHNSGDVISLASNQFLLKAGTYRIVASAPGYGVDRHRISLWAVASNTRLLNGRSALALTTDFSNNPLGRTQTWATLETSFILVANTLLELRHYTALAVPSLGLGVAVNEGINEVYAKVELWRLD